MLCKKQKKDEQSNTEAFCKQQSNKGETSNYMEHLWKHL